MSDIVRTTQAVILARGLGTRMRRAQRDAGDLTDAQRAAADAGVKGMMPFERPFLDFVISALADAGIDKVVFVVAPDADQIREYYEMTGRPTRVDVAFAIQREPLGTADAVLAARPSVGDAPFLALNSDNYYPVEAYRTLVELGGAALIGFDGDTLMREGGIEAERVSRYALIDFDDDGSLVEIVEKPPAEHPLMLREGRWVSMNLWSFTPRIFDACEQVKPSARGELELVDAVTIAIREFGERFRVLTMHAGVLDLSSQEDIAYVASRLARLHPET